MTNRAGAAGHTPGRSLGAADGEPADQNGHGRGAGDQARITQLSGLAAGVADVRPPSALLAGNGLGEAVLPEDAQRPVFVLTVARSGSTLLRFILDSHPELACPPETNIGQVCFGLARLWDILDPPVGPAATDFSPLKVPDLPGEAVTLIRGVVDHVYGRYLARHGKRRWCDKSLDSVKLAGLLAQVYPGAQFVCLYRHCMDVVVSAVEAAPWGLTGYGFDPYVAGTPGNAVLAAARCWLDQTTGIIEFQEKHPGRCHGIRYEDLVTASEDITADLFTFLGVEPVPGLTETCLAQAHESRGPADHKIWFTTSITAGSLGQGTRVPAGMLPPEFLTHLNETLDQLAYRQIDDTWRNATGPLDPRADTPPDGTSTSPPEGHDTQLEAAAAEISARLAAVTAQRAADLAARWPQAAHRTLCLAIGPPGPGPRTRRCWTITFQDGALAVGHGQDPPDDAVTLTAPARTWQALLASTANLAAELRAGRIRLLDPTAPSDGPPTSQDVARLLAHLTGLAAQHEPARPRHWPDTTSPEEKHKEADPAR